MEATGVGGMTSIKEMTPKEILDTCRSDTILNKVRAIVSNAHATMEQDALQRMPPPPIEVRRTELLFAEQICMLFSKLDTST